MKSENKNCQNCKKDFIIEPDDFGFYEKMGLPLPKQCFNCRHERRMKARNPRSLWDMKCAKCGKEIKTSYTPENQKIYKIFCEKCYQQEVY